jgi:hypothetical protein
MRTAKISTTVSMKVNTGNYETVEVAKSIETDVTFEKVEELAEKSKNLDKTAFLMLKEETEYMLTQLGRKRHIKVNGKELPIGLFDSF